MIDDPVVWTDEDERRARELRETSRDRDLTTEERLELSEIRHREMFRVDPDGVRMRFDSDGPGGKWLKVSKPRDPQAWAERLVERGELEAVTS